MISALDKKGFHSSQLLLLQCQLHNFIKDYREDIMKASTQISSEPSLGNRHRCKEPRVNAPYLALSAMTPRVSRKLPSLLCLSSDPGTL